MYVFERTRAHTRTNTRTHKHTHTQTHTHTHTHTHMHACTVCHTVHTHVCTHTAIVMTTAVCVHTDYQCRSRRFLHIILRLLLYIYSLKALSCISCQGPPCTVCNLFSLRFVRHGVDCILQKCNNSARRSTYFLRSLCTFFWTVSFLFVIICDQIEMVRDDRPNFVVSPSDGFEFWTMY